MVDCHVPRGNDDTFINRLRYKFLLMADIAGDASELFLIQPLTAMFSFMHIIRRINITILKGTMKKKEEFEKLIDSVLNRFTQAKDLRGRVYIDTEEILRIFINLNHRIEEQREHIDELSKKLKDSEKNLNLLIKELVRSGYIKIGEKRNYLQRNIHSVEAIIALLQKKNILNKKELIRELKKSRDTEKKASKT